MKLSSREHMALVKKLVQCRDLELDLLSSFITYDAVTLVPSLIVHGYKSVGKTYTVETHLKTLGVKHTIIKCDESITKKLLLQRCLKRIRTDSGVDLSKYNQIFNYKGIEVTNVSKLCETFINFVSSLEQFIEETGYNDHHVLVLDRFDQCMESINDLLLGFLRLQEQSKIKNITVILIVSSEDIREITTNATPRLYFGAYLQSDIITILQSNRFCSFGKNYSSKEVSEFWNQYTKAIVDTFFSYTGPDLTLIKDICQKLWPSFVQPILSGKYSIHDFVKIYRDNRDLFTSETVVNNSFVEDLDNKGKSLHVDNTAVSDLPLQSKFILIASYLASYNEAKNDLHLFSRVKVTKERKKKALPSKNKNGFLTKEILDAKLFSPNYFDLERLLAIVSVIYRNESDSLHNRTESLSLSLELPEQNIINREKEFSTFTLNSSIDLNSQIASLASLGLLTRTYALDILSSKVRWKCNISWPMVEAIAKDINFPLQNYLISS